MSEKNSTSVALSSSLYVLRYLQISLSSPPLGNLDIGTSASVNQPVLGNAFIDDALHPPPFVSKAMRRPSVHLDVPTERLGDIIIKTPGLKSCRVVTIAC